MPNLTFQTLRQFIVDHPLGILTTAIKSDEFPLLLCTHIPWVTDAKDDSNSADSHILRGHLARANPHSKAMSESCTSRSSNVLEEEVMVLFNSPTNHYVTPKFYTKTKPKTGKVVPTWDYAAVQAYGKATIYFDTHSDETVGFLIQQIHDLSVHAETSVMGYLGGDSGKPGPWSVSDAPPKFIELLRKAIVGIKIDVTRLEGRFKMSQELPQRDREGVIEGFQALGTENGDEMARWVKQRGDMKDAAKDG